MCGFLGANEGGRGLALAFFADIKMLDRGLVVDTIDLYINPILFSTLRVGSEAVTPGLFCVWREDLNALVG